MHIRPCRPGDAAALSDIYRRSVTQLGPADYTGGQVEAWLSCAPTTDQMHARCTDGRTCLVMVAAPDRPVAFGDLEVDGHIDLLYCAPEAAGTGAASAIYDALEATARERGLQRLYVEASEAARRLFTHKGFTVTARRDFVIGGVQIHNYAMEKLL